jgi:hypothetical protein
MTQPLEIPESDTIATPEGDNEFAPDQPLAPVEGLETPNGAEPAAYDTDEPSSLAKNWDEFVEVLDEVSRGKIQP